MRVKGRMKVLLVSMNSAYVHTNSAAVSLAAFAMQHKTPHDLAVIDFNINQHMHHVLEAILNEKPDLTAFSCYIWNMGQVMRLAEDLKRVRPHIQIMLGGPEVSFDAKQVMEEHPFIDFVLCGEGEEAFAAFLCGGQEVPGLLWREQNRVCGNSQYNTVKDLSILPMPFAPPAQAKHDPNKLFYYEASRGCPYHCAYCLAGVETAVREKPLETVLADIDEFVRREIPLVKLADRTFNCNKKRAYAIWEHIINHGGRTRFHFEVALDLLDKPLLDLLETAPPGRIQLEAGVQSCNERTLEAVVRKTNLARLMKNGETLIAVGNIPLHLDLIAGLPYEGMESFAQSFDQVFNLFPDRLQLGFLKVLKGSALREMCAAYGIKYRSYPPYEVLETADMSAENLLTLKGVEELLNRYYNTGRAKRALRFLLDAGISPFGYFMAFLEYCRQNGFDIRPVSAQNQFLLMMDFSKNFLEASQYQSFLAYLKADYLDTKIKGRMPDELQKVTAESG